MATAGRNVTMARDAASSRRAIARMPKRTRTAPGQQRAAVSKRARAGGDSPETRTELNEIARQRDLPGRAKTVLDDLASEFGYK
jgi:hypothetical protein